MVKTPLLLFGVGTIVGLGILLTRYPTLLPAAATQMGISGTGLEGADLKSSGQRTMASEPPTDAVRGILHSYQSSPGLTAFEIVEHERHEKVVIFIGGLSDSYLTVPYLRPLGRELAREGWGVVQVTLSSSALGYGTTSLAKDVEELAKWVY